jgi:TonB family protein
MAQEALQKLPPESAGLRVNQVVTVCGEALDLGCHGPHRAAILTFISPSASPSLSIGVAAGAQIDIDAPSLGRARRVCATGKVATMVGGYQLQIANRDHLVYSTEPTPVPSLADRPHRACDPGVVIPKLRRDVKAQLGPGVRRNISGKVVLQGLVDTSGLMRDVQVIRSLDPGGLDAAAAAAFAQWQFDPGRSNGKPVPMMVVADMWFTLRRD